LSSGQRPISNEGKLLRAQRHFSPSFSGNIIKPSEASSAPSVGFDLPHNSHLNVENPTAPEAGSFWTLVMSNPDGHLRSASDGEDADFNEYLHWMVANIPADGDMAKADVLVPYLQPFPPFGTGYHRIVFTLYRRSEGPIDLGKYRAPAADDGRVDLSARTFSTKAMLAEAKTSLTPAGLAFFQTDYESSLRRFFHQTLNMKEPRYEYHFTQPFVAPWNRFFPKKYKQAFNLFLDRYREPKDVQEELVRKKLASFDPFSGDAEKKRRRFPAAHVIDPSLPQWRRREIERERLRHGVYKDLDWRHLRRDPTYS